MKGKDYPGLALSRSIGDQIAHNIGVSAVPGKILILYFIEIKIVLLDRKRA
jgi:hypothetical protein